MTNIGAFTRTVTYLTPYQIWARIDYRFRCLYYNTFLYGLLEQDVEPCNDIVVTPAVLWKGSKKAGREIAELKFNFLNQKINMGKDINWYPKEATTLWVYHLHYFEWLKHLNALKQEGLEQAREMVGSWIFHCDHFHKISWHPYPLSLRIISWLTYANWLTDGASQSFKNQFYDSLARQVDHLQRVVEWDVEGNHIIKNLKALIFVGLCVKGKQSIYLDSLETLLTQLKKQVLPDGGHYERSPHYHVDVLKDLIEIKSLITKSGQKVPPQFDDVIDRMVEVLVFYRYPDGCLGLFNDGEINSAKNLDEILKYRGSVEKPLNLLEDTGYARLERGKTMLMVDVGKCCPDELPAHAHADTLSFELCVDKERIFVNQGTYLYQHRLRNVLRGTKAHNTVCVDDENSAEVWKTFRLGRRPQKITCEVKEAPQVGIGVEASHDGYKHINVSHERRIFLSEDGESIKGEDFISGKKKHKAEAFFHLHPDVKFHLISYTEVELTTKNKQRFSFKIKGGVFQEREGIYAPHFGQKEPIKTLFVKGKWDPRGQCVIKWGATKK
jgi:uncharacterized heparinase superfamily protein